MSDIRDYGTIAAKYKETAIDMLHLQFPYLSADEINRAVDWSINNRFRDTNVYLDNNYKKQQINSTLLEVSNYILDKGPIITAYGVLFSKHGTVPNPMYHMIDSFVNRRDQMKKEMFKYPKGSEQFAKYNLWQQLAKIDSNAIYGAMGKFSCIYFNLYVSSSVTTQGRSCISAASLLFESILNNNVPFGSLNELIQFIHNVKNQNRNFIDDEILDTDISVSECFFQLMSSSGFGWIPSESEMEIVWDIVRRLDQCTINRLFYKNNLLHFIDNRKVMDLIVCILQTLKEPFLNPNKVPEEIKDMLDVFYDLITEYVYYDHQIIDRIEKMDSLIRSVSVIMDTDSAIVSLDGWYRYVRDRTLYVPMKIKDIFTPKINATDDDLHMDPKPVKAQYTEYDFLSDEIIDVERDVHTDDVIPQDSYRMSIINIIANVLGRIILDYMYKYTVNSQSAAPDRKCMMIMKNEFLFRRILQIPDAKKNYASNMELQEGNIIPEAEKLDIKGIPCFVKTTLNESTRNVLKKILFDDILNIDEIDQIKLLRDLAMVEKNIYNSLHDGSKDYLKPVRIKSMNNYENPMGIQGIKASVAYNTIKPDDMDVIDLEARNSISIIKTDMSMKNIDLIKDTYPDVWAKAIELMKLKDFDGSIDAIALPANEEVPGWVIPFIKYYDIINDNIGLFPLESLRIYRGGSNNNYTNMIEF
jgi:hypothetical protein